MKRLLVVSWSKNLGGVERSLIEFLNYISGLDYSVNLVTVHDGGELESEIPRSVIQMPQLAGGRGIKTEFLNSSNKIKVLLNYLVYRFKLFCGKSVCQAAPKTEGHFDIAIAYDDGKDIPYYVAHKVNASKKILFYHYGKVRGYSNNKDKNLKLFDNFDHLVFVAQTIMQNFISEFPALEGKAVLAHNLLNEREILQKANEQLDCFNAESENCLTIVSVGRLTEDKGFDLAIDVAKELKKYIAFRWILVGDGPKYDDLKNRIDSLELSDVFFMVGAQSNPYPYIQRCDLYVQPSVVEAEGISVREAIVLKKPVITSDIPAFRETLNNGKYGCLCERTSECFVNEILAFNEKKNKSVIDFPLYDVEQINQESKEVFRKILKI